MVLDTPVMILVKNFYSFVFQFFGQVPVCWFYTWVCRTVPTVTVGKW